jgi:PhzF family phenazine biosynthesis protein
LLRDGPLDNSLLERSARALGLDRRTIRAHQWVDNGPGWCAVMLDSAQRVRSVRPDFSMIHDLKLGLIGPQSQGSDTAFEVRAFVPALGVPEDPVTGSLNAGLALWLMRVGLAPNRYVAAQGSALGRSGRIHVERLGEDVWVGGDVTNVIQGTVQLPLK